MALEVLTVALTRQADGAPFGRDDTEAVLAGLEVPGALHAAMAGDAAWDRLRVDFAGGTCIDMGWLLAG